MGVECMKSYLTSAHHKLWRDYHFLELLAQNLACFASQFHSQNTEVCAAQIHGIEQPLLAPAIENSKGFVRMPKFTIGISLKTRPRVPSDRECSLSTMFVDRAQAVFQAQSNCAVCYDRESLTTGKRERPRPGH